MVSLERLHYAFRTKFGSLFGNEFQSWIVEIYKALHSGGDFHSPTKQQVTVALMDF